MTVGPLAAKYGVPYLVEYKGEKFTGVRHKQIRTSMSASADWLSDIADTTSWIFLTLGDDSEVIFHHEPEARVEDFGEITPLAPARSIARDDLPEFRSLLNVLTDDDPDHADYGTRVGLSRVMDAVVAHLNERGGVPAERGKSYFEKAQQLDNELARRNEELSEAQDKIAALKRMTARMADERNRNVEAKFEALAERDEARADRDKARALAESKLGYPPLDLRHADLTNRAERAEAERDYWKKEAGKEAYNGFAMRDEVQRKLDAAENRPTLDREAVEAAIARWLAEPSEGDDDAAPLVDAIMSLTPAAKGWPERLGPKIDPDDFDVYRGAFGNIHVDGEYFCVRDATPETVRDGYPPSVRIAAKHEAVARFIESEQAATGDEDQRVEEWSRKAAHIMAQSACDEELSQSHEVIAILAERLIPRGRALVDAGWTPPESEATAVNPWWEQFLDALADAHDETCAEGERCRDRHRHISEAYMSNVVKRFFDTKPDLQSGLIQSAKELGL